MSPVTGLILLIVSVLLFALLNSMEIALVGSSKVRARHLAEQGSTMAKALARLQREQDRFFSATVRLSHSSRILLSLKLNFKAPPCYQALPIR